MSVIVVPMTILIIPALGGDVGSSLGHVGAPHPSTMLKGYAFIVHCGIFPLLAVALDFYTGLFGRVACSPRCTISQFTLCAPRPDAQL
eukprot:11864-Pleurochrysis_carterae.AAC.2